MTSLRYALLWLLFVPGLALANRLENIGSGLSGNHYLKVKQIAGFSLWLGVALGVLGVLVILLRGRMHSGVAPGVVLAVLGAVLLAFGLWKG